MRGRNPAPWILAITVLAAAAAFVIVGQSHPEDVSGQKKGTAAVIVIGIGIVVMVIAQTIWTTRSTRRAELSALRAASGTAGTLDDPAQMNADELLVALATVTVDAGKLLEARSAGWDMTRATQRSAAIMTALVIVLMVPAIALQKPQVIVVAAVPIVLYAVVLAVKVIRPGGTMDRAYEVADVQLAPLGLQTAARPQMTVQPQGPGDGAQVRLIGPTVFAGQRHGRAVQVQTDSRWTQTSVAGSFGSFALEGRRQRLEADGPVPEAVGAMLASLEPSSCWTSVKLSAGADGIVVTRRTDSDREWLYDLWLAERIAALS